MPLCSRAHVEAVNKQRVHHAVSGEIDRQRAQPAMATISAARMACSLSARDATHLRRERPTERHCGSRSRW